MKVELYSRFEALKKQHDRDLVIRESIKKTALWYQVKIKALEDKQELCDKAALLLSDVSISAKRSVISFLEEVVTDAILYISEGQYGFKIDLDDTGKTTKCEFYITEDIDGEISMQKPQDACGGGFIDIISTTLRYAYLNLYSEPRLMGAVILDEPGKMVSKEMSVRFGEFIQKLGAEFDRQTIMITHNSNLTNIADKVETII